MNTPHNVAPNPPPFRNRLIEAASPYLTQHAHNPVDWYEWGPEALAAARSTDKPILISIGYAACHWCHVMAHESFEDPAVAAIQNELFINIKVDREERPDLDSVYMSAAQAMTGQGGWPLNVFCLPDGTPFYGGTYFPPEAKAARYRMPSWSQVLRSIAEAYRSRRQEIESNAHELTQHLARLSHISASADESLSLSAIIDDAVSALAASFDQQHGGFGDAPKFPQPMTLEFLLRAYLRDDRRALPMLEQTLQTMARGGIYDQLGGGFHRYSVDNYWLVPHFEKMLYDNALLARLYCETYQVTRNPFYRRIASETLDYLISEMRHPQGGFYSTQDADSLPYPGASHAEEGLFYVWTPEELRQALGKDATLFSTIYNVSQQGNFEGRNILHRPRDLSEIARVTGSTVAQLEHLIETGRRRLLEIRAQRPHPFRDEKIISAWNGMALRALAVAAAAFADDTGQSERYREAAQACADMLLTTLRRNDGRLLRSWKDGRSGPLGFLEDYALVIDGLLALHAIDGNPRWMHASLNLAEAMIALFWDAELGGFFDTARDQEALVTRPRDIGDNATPAGNSVATELLLRLAALTGNERYRDMALHIITSLGEMLQRFPAGFGRMLCAADLATASIQEIALIGRPEAADTGALLQAVLGDYRPHIVLARLSPNDQETTQLSPLLQNRPTIADQATAYVCRNFVCTLPVTTPEALRSQLERRGS
jgi:uncharacterized protein YyaL (SSP411 family)